MHVCLFTCMLLCLLVYQITDSPRGGQEGGSGRVFLCEQELCVLPTVVSILHVFISHCNDWKYMKYRSNTIIPYLVFDLYVMYYNRLIIDNAPILLFKTFLFNYIFAVSLSVPTANLIHFIVECF